MTRVLEEANFSELVQRSTDTVNRLLRTNKHALRLRRRGQDEDLVLLTATRSQQEGEIVDVAIRLLRSVLSDPVVRSKSLPDIIPGAFPWTRLLPIADQVKFAQELVNVMEASSDIDNPEPILDTIEQWRHTAEVYSSPRLLAQLRQPVEDFGPAAEPAA